MVTVWRMFYSFIIGVLICAIFFVFKPFVLIQDNSKVFERQKIIVIKKSDITIDNTNKIISVAPQHVEIQQRQYKVIEDIGIASNSLEVKNVVIQDNTSLIDKIINALPLILAGIAIGKIN